MNAVREGFHCLVNFGADVASADIGHRAKVITDTVLTKISKFRTQPPTVEEWLLGEAAKVERLRDVPIADFDATRDALAKFIKKKGCSEVSVRGDKYRLSELLEQMASADELLAPYRKLLAAHAS